MRTLKGIPVSAGVVIGRVAHIDDASAPRIQRRTIRPDQVDDALERVESARATAAAELQALYAEAREEMGDEAAKIFLFHIGALSDKAITEPIRQRITEKFLAPEYAVDRTFRDLAEQFARKGDTTFTTKVNDIHDLSSRLITLLVGAKLADTRSFDEGTVVVARDLTPSQTAGFDRERVVAMVTDLGGQTSHTAIVARALGLPAVVGCRGATAAAEDGSTIIVDGDLGAVIVDPDEETLDAYTERRSRVEARRRSLAELADTPAQTRDGSPVTLLGNIEFAEEVEQVLRFGGEGVGLYRTEFLFLTSPTEPTEDDQFAAYAACVQALDGRPLTIRTMDLGADKYTQARAEIPERNPFLGLRSIRYCLRNLPMFRTQLRALLRASALGPLKIMFPLITSTHEFRQAKMILHDTMEDLADSGVEFDPHIEVGMMVEVPSAALQADVFAREAAFFSIGTNDLVQYTLAVDRTNERVAEMHNPYHPAVLRLIRTVSRSARRRDVPVSCCGEAAGEPEFAALLIGLGVRTLSVTSSSIPRVKEALAGITLEQCERIAKRAIRFDSEIEAAAYTRDRVRKIVPDAFDGRPVEDT